MKNLWLISLFLTVAAASPTSAQTCSLLPTCEELGYTKSETDCVGKSMVRCPLNKGKIYCEEGKALTSCPPGYADIDIIEPYCKGTNDKLIFSDSSLKCAKCQSCGQIGHFSQVAGCCPDDTYASDGCAGYQTFNIQDSNGCWTCSRCRNQYGLDENGNCTTL